MADGQAARFVVPVRYLVNAETDDVVVVVSDEDWEAMQEQPVELVIGSGDLDVWQRDARLIHFLPESNVGPAEPPPGRRLVGPS